MFLPYFHTCECQYSFMLFLYFRTLLLLFSYIIVYSSRYYFLYFPYLISILSYVIIYIFWCYCLYFSISIFTYVIIYIFWCYRLYFSIFLYLMLSSLTCVTDLLFTFFIKIFSRSLLSSTLYYPFGISLPSIIQS